MSEEQDARGRPCLITHLRDHLDRSLVSLASALAERDAMEERAERAERRAEKAEVARDEAREATSTLDAEALREVAEAVLDDRSLCDAHFRQGNGTPTKGQERAREERDRLLASVIARVLARRGR